MKCSDKIAAKYIRRHESGQLNSQQFKAWVKLAKDWIRPVLWWNSLGAEVQKPGQRPCKTPSRQGPLERPFYRWRRGEIGAEVALREASAPAMVYQYYEIHVLALSDAFVALGYTGREWTTGQVEVRIDRAS